MKGIDVTSVIAKTWVDKYDTIPKVGDRIEVRGGSDITVTKHLHNAIAMEKARREIVYDVYHWDTFDNETIKINPKGFKTIEAAEKFAHKHYGDRLDRPNGADRVDIVERYRGKIVRSFTVG
jgi:hypothetical protein